MERLRINGTFKPDRIPEYATKHASGADLKADIEGPVSVGPGERILIPTGIHLEIPAGFEGQVRPRSGLAAKHGLTVLNSPGTIDADYRGEVKVILINHGKSVVSINPGDRIAQLVFMPVVRTDFVSVESVNDTERGKGGFGSTGVSHNEE